MLTSAWLHPNTLVYLWLWIYICIPKNHLKLHFFSSSPGFNSFSSQIHAQIGFGCVHCYKIEESNLLSPFEVANEVDEKCLTSLCMPAVHLRQANTSRILLAARKRLLDGVASICIFSCHSLAHTNSK